MKRQKIKSPADRKRILSAIDAIFSKHFSFNHDVIDNSKEILLTLSGEHIDMNDSITKASGDVKVAKKMLRLLVDGFYEDLPLLVAAKKNDDWDTIQNIIHKQRGGSYYCGTPRFSQICTQLETYLLAKKTKWRDALYQQVLDEMENIAHLKNLYTSE